MNRTEQLESLRSRLEKPELQDPQFFVGVLKAAIQLFTPLTDATLAREFGMTRSTATRWRNGTAVPHPAMRRPVFSYLLGLAKKELKDLSRETGRSSWTSEAPVSLAAQGR